MKKLRIAYPLASIVALGTAIQLDRMGVRSQWLAGGFLVLGVLLLVVGVTHLPSAARSGARHLLSAAAAAGLGAGVLFIGVNILWPSYGLDTVGYVLFIVSMILGSWPQRARGRHVGA
jgi:hypothetical protein